MEADLTGAWMPVQGASAVQTQPPWSSKDSLCSCVTLSCHIQLTNLIHTRVPSSNKCWLTARGGTGSGKFRFSLCPHRNRIKDTVSFPFPHSQALPPFPHQHKFSLTCAFSPHTQVTSSSLHKQRVCKNKASSLTKTCLETATVL